MSKDTVIIDGDRLRIDLIDYYGSAMASGFPMAIMDLAKAENASGEELLELAKNAGVDLADYIID